jgi:hypothetical protein
MARRGRRHTEMLLVAAAIVDAHGRGPLAASRGPSPIEACASMDKRTMNREERMVYRRRLRRPGERRFARIRPPAAVFTPVDVAFIDYLVPLTVVERTLEPDEAMTALIRGRRPREVELSPWGAAAAAVIAAAVEGDHRLFPCSLRSWALSVTCAQQLKAGAARAARKTPKPTFLVRFGDHYILQATTDTRALFGTPFAVDVTVVMAQLCRALKLREAPA